MSEHFARSGKKEARSIAICIYFAEFCVQFKRRKVIEIFPSIIENCDGFT